MRFAGHVRIKKSTIVRFIVLATVTVLCFPFQALATGVEAPCRDEPLCVTDDMRAWAQAKVAHLGRQPTARLHLLHDALIAPQGLGLREIDHATHTAREVFERREANCVGFALLFTALARALDLDVRFVRLDRVEGYDDRGGLRVGATHLAIAFGTERRPVVADFGGVQRLTGPWRPTTDAEAMAIFHANRGAEHLTEGRVDDAISALDKAIALAPQMQTNWVNLGVALSRSGRGRDAEAAYRRAIQLEPESLAAWRNLAILLTRDARP